MLKKNLQFRNRISFALDFKRRQAYTISNNEVFFNKGCKMTYLEEFKAQMNSRNFPKFLQLWEEYSSSDQADVEEFALLLTAIKNSDFSKSFGKLVETALPLWQTITDKNDSYNILKLLIDLQITNTPQLADLSLHALKERYSDQPQYNERIRIVGLRTRENFQGALSNYDLLSHMEVGKFVFHTGGWGTGEIMEISPIRQQVTIEFENVAGRKHLNYENAFKTIIPLNDDNFYVRRFSDPDRLEKEAREDPIGVIKLLLRDMGPKSAGEIKDELSELVIPEKEWTKWWSGARGKLKKDPIIETPESLKETFKLRKSEISQEELLKKAIHHKTDVNDIILTAYNFLRDLPNVKKNQEVRNSLKDKLLENLSNPEITPEQELQICICLENHFNFEVPGKSSKALVQDVEDIEKVIHAIEIVALKKRALSLVKENRSDWVELYLKFMMTIKHTALRDFLFKELNQNSTKPKLIANLQKLMQAPENHPESFIWYFQKLVENEDEVIPFGDQEGLCNWFESFLMLMHRLETKPEYRDLVKKMYTQLSGKRYAMVRAIIEKASLEYVKEFLLLASKCQTLTDHDRKILRSLAAVVHSELGQDKRIAQKEKEAHIVWTTEEGYLKTQEQVQRIGTVEIVENAREIEAARALGDLRENSEYKFALEKRSRLQGELKTLSEQLKHARVISKDDISPDEVSVGAIVVIADSKNKKNTYTILGPWDAVPDQNILSFQSKLAQAMIGCKVGETFEFKDEKFKVLDLKSYLDK
jgi:transcription elongation factor GreA-like protein/transcription elongation GreA/GreB family factor